MSKESDFSKWIQGELDDLRRIRDELEVQAHLGKAEMRSAWEKLEDRLGELERHRKQIARAAEEPLQKLEADARQLARDLREGFRRIRDSI